MVTYIGVNEAILGGTARSERDVVDEILKCCMRQK